MLVWSASLLRGTPRSTSWSASTSARRLRHAPTSTSGSHDPSSDTPFLMLKEASRMGALPRSACRGVSDALRWVILSLIMPRRATDGFPVYGHRFGGDYGPESSRAALEKSLAHGVDGLECDIILSGDDEVFALHDPDLALSTNLEGWARAHTADEIDEGCIRGPNGEVSDQHPLRLRAVLEDRKSVV